MPDSKETAEIIFPPLPEKEDWPWFRRLPEVSRKKLASKRDEIIREDTKRLSDRIRSLPGFEDVPDESVEHLALRWAITLANAFGEGVQSSRDTESTVAFHEITIGGFCPNPRG